MSENEGRILIEAHAMGVWISSLRARWKRGGERLRESEGPQRAEGRDESEKMPMAVAG